MKKEKKYTGSPSVVALSMAPTQGNGPYSNSLKDEGYKGSNAQTQEGGRNKKERQGRDGEAPFHASLSPHSEQPALH